MDQTLKEFLEGYEGFNFEAGEVVIVDRRSAKQFISTYRKGMLISRKAVPEDVDRLFDRPVWHWTHTKATMLIVL